MEGISVVIAAYVSDDYTNCARFLRQALGSVLGQDPAPLEIFVVYGPSPAGLEALIGEYRSAVRFVHEPRPGDAPARNLGIRMSSGSMIASVDSDDYWAKNKLQRQMRAFADDPWLEAVFTHAHEFFEPASADEPLRMSDVLPAHIPASMLIKRESFLRVGYYDESYRIGGAVDWYVRAQESGLRAITLPDVLLFGRLHSHNAGRRMEASKPEYLHVLKGSLDRKRAK